LQHGIKGEAFGPPPQQMKPGKMKVASDGGKRQKQGELKSTRGRATLTAARRKK